MTIRFNLLRYLLISALLFSLRVCHAQSSNVTGTVTFSFGDTPATQLWDLSGGYSLNLVINQHNGIQVPLQLNFNLVEDARGNLTAPPGDFQALTFGDSAPALFTVSYTITGKVTGSGGAARARFTIRMTGNGTVGGITVNSMSAILVVDAQPNAEDGLLHGPARFSAKFSNGVEGVSGTIGDIATALPAGVDGTWTLTLQVAAFNSLSGSAVVATSSRTFGFVVTGPFDQSSGDFDARLHGASTSTVPNTMISGAGSDANARIDTSFNLFILDGTFMGQRLSISPD